MCILKSNRLRRSARCDSGTLSGVAVGEETESLESRASRKRATRALVPACLPACLPVCLSVCLCVRACVRACVYACAVYAKSLGSVEINRVHLRGSSSSRSSNARVPLRSAPSDEEP